MELVCFDLMRFFEGVTLPGCFLGNGLTTYLRGGVLQ